MPGQPLRQDRAPSLTAALAALRSAIEQLDRRIAVGPAQPWCHVSPDAPRRIPGRGWLDSTGTGPWSLYVCSDQFEWVYAGRFRAE